MATAEAAPPTQTQKGTKKRKKDKDKTPVMEGQTEEERRILRQEQRTAQDRIGDRQHEMTKMDSDAFAEERDNNNQLFKKVRFNREMVNDGDIMVSLAEVAIKRAGALARSVRQYSAADIATALRAYYAEGAGCADGDGVFDWAALGADGAGLFRAPPEIAILCGPLEKPAKERKKIERAKKKAPTEDENKATQFDERQGGDAGGDAGEVDEATNLRLQRLNDVMDARMRSGGVPLADQRDHGGAGLELMSLVVNPDSFCETVENMFDLSFLVKDNKATVGIDDATGLPSCRLAEAPDQALPKTQNVVVLSMADCKKIGELWNIEGGHTPLERDTPRPPPTNPEDEDDAE